MVKQMCTQLFYGPTHSINSRDWVSKPSSFHFKTSLCQVIHLIGSAHTDPAFPRPCPSKQLTRLVQPIGVVNTRSPAPLKLTWLAHPGPKRAVIAVPPFPGILYRRNGCVQVLFQTVAQPATPLQAMKLWKTAMNTCFECERVDSGRVEHEEWRMKQGSVKELRVKE